jgi:hypothetical protein
LFSDHRIRHYGSSPFQATEASSFSPNDPTHDSASSTTGQTLDSFWTSASESSQYVQEWWTDFPNDVFPNHEIENIASASHSGLQDDPFYGSSEYIDPSLLTLLEHEPRHSPASGVSQYIPEALAQSSSQLFLDQHIPNFEQFPATQLPYLESDSDKNEWQRGHFPDPSLLESTELTSTPTSSPVSAGHFSSDLSDGKIEIDAAQLRHVCQTCHQVFTGLRYWKHINALSCQKLFSCQECGHKFKTAKDLRRHRGPDQTSSACLKPRRGGLQAKPFACTCNLKTYTRKDSLLRHLRKHVHDESQRHRCKACNGSPCSCVTVNSR